MRKKRALLVTTVGLVLFGVVSILIGIFAYSWGLDNNAVMGAKRKLLIGLGMLALLLRPIWTISENAIKHTGLSKKWGQFTEHWQKSRFIVWLNSRHPGPVGRFFDRHDWIWIIVGGGVVTLITLWYLTAGTLTQWTPYSQYFNRQADAFLAGQLDLLEKPPAAFTTLSNVYDWKQRDGIDYLWDASYFNGKYYLYWGPVPALIAAGIKLFHPGVVEDQVLILIFVSGLSLVMGALFTCLRRRYFPSTPSWMSLLFTLTSLFAVQVFWLVNRPDVYEAAIASAQLFLWLGIYGALRALEKETVSQGWLWLAGFGFGAAVGSRFSSVLAVIFASAVIAVTLFKRQKSSGFKILSWIAFGFPLACFAAGLAAYNFARFGSILESGMRYQLTGDVVPADFWQIFSIQYLLPNAYSSLVRPLGTTPGQFPFFSTPFILDNMWPNFIHRVKTYYFGEPVAGILAAIPFLWMLILLPLRWLRRLLNWIHEKVQHQTNLIPSWVLWLMVGITLVQMCVTLSFAQATMRYVADFAILAITCTVLLVDASIENLKHSPGWRRLVILLSTLLCISAIMIGLLTNMQGADYRFEKDNPDLYNRIAEIFQ